MQKMTDYKINTDTLAIVPINKKESFVYENNNIFIVTKNPNKIIKYNCIYNGSSLKGRLEGTKDLTGYIYKAPILINDNNNIIFFPTSSIRLNTVAWISLNNLENCYFDSRKNICVIKFYNGVRIKLDMSINVLNNQILKASRLETIIRKNKLCKT